MLGKSKQTNLKNKPIILSSKSIALLMIARDLEFKYVQWLNLPKFCPKRRPSFPKFFFFFCSFNNKTVFETMEEIPVRETAVPQFPSGVALKR